MSNPGSKEGRGIPVTPPSMMTKEDSFEGYRCLYLGIDTLDFAIKGRLSKQMRNKLRIAKEKSSQGYVPEVITVGEERLSVSVLGAGLRGGYAFRVDSGPIGALFAFKDNDDKTQWNGFVSIRSAALLTRGYLECRNFVLNQLKSLGFDLVHESVNRVDFAIDVAAPEFCLNMECLVTHPKMTKKTFWTESDVEYSGGSLFSIMRGKTVESVTIGKMPGRQIIIYDKKKEITKKQKTYWFDAWGYGDKKGESVWRIEVRAGKSELKDRWSISTFSELDRLHKSLVADIVKSVRLINPCESETNITRAPLHPIWRLVCTKSNEYLTNDAQNAKPEIYKEYETSRAKNVYGNMLRAGAIGLAVAYKLNGADFCSLIRDVVEEELGLKSKVRFSELRRSFLKKKSLTI